MVREQESGAELDGFACGGGHGVDGEVHVLDGRRRGRPRRADGVPRLGTCGGPQVLDHGLEFAERRHPVSLPRRPRRTGSRSSRLAVQPCMRRRQQPTEVSRADRSDDRQRAAGDESRPPAGRGRRCRRGSVGLRPPRQRPGPRARRRVRQDDGVLAVAPWCAVSAAAKAARSMTVGPVAGRTSGVGRVAADTGDTAGRPRTGRTGSSRSGVTSSTSRSRRYRRLRVRRLCCGDGGAARLRGVGSGGAPG